MPTTAKLVSMLLFAVVLAVAAVNYASAMPDGMSAGWLVPAAGFAGAICGWWIMGGYLMRKRNLQDALGTGIRTALTGAVIVLVCFAFYDTMIRSMEHRYNDANDLFLGLFDRVITHGEAMVTLPVLGVLFFGGAVAGVVGLWVARRWS